MNKYDGIVLFSGGLDSILAARLLMEQGLSIKCLHFISPFFGKPTRVRHWEREYGLDISIEDVSDDYAAMLARGPVYGFGSVINPCVDCKILMMRRAKIRMEALGAQFIASGEVLGQRPMSQRRDTLNVIRRDADVKDVLLRPLCAQHLDPTSVELSGLVDRSRLLGFSGRGRKDQMELAARFGITEIPTPGGGCMLTEKENARRYWPVMEFMRAEHIPIDPQNAYGASAADYRLSNVGRQVWKDSHWLCIGRNQADNDVFASLARENDIVFKVAGFPGPLALARLGQTWPEDILREAADLVASYSPKALRAAEDGTAVSVKAIPVNGPLPKEVDWLTLPYNEIAVMPRRESAFIEPTWETAHLALSALHKGTSKDENLKPQ